MLWGLPAADARRSPIMPGDADVLTDQQLANLVAYVRAKFSNKPPWTDVDKAIGDARSGVRPVEVYPAPRIDPARLEVADQHETK